MLRGAEGLQVFGHHVSARVLRCMRLDDDASENRFRRPSNVKWTDPKRRERVDQILSEELQEEAQHWIDYDTEELEAKTKLGDVFVETIEHTLLSEAFVDMMDIRKDRQKRHFVTVFGFEFWIKKNDGL